MVKTPFDQSFQNRYTLAALGVARISTPTRLQWLAWRPPDSGFALDLALLTTENTRVSGIVQNQSGRLIIAATHEYHTCGPLTDSLSFLDDIIAYQTTLRMQIKYIRSSHDSFWGIENEESFPPTDIYVLRRIQS